MTPGQGLPVSMFWAKTNSSSPEVLTITSRSLWMTSVVASRVFELTVTAITPACSPSGSGTSIALSSFWYLANLGTLNSKLRSGSISEMFNCCTPRTWCILRK